MTGLPPELAAEVRSVLGALESLLSLPHVEPVVHEGGLRAYLQDRTLLVPASYVRHFERFGTVPTALVRDAAYELKKRRLALDGARGPALEADALSFAERFLRDTVLKDSD